jgi:hypothetical protein
MKLFAFSGMIPRLLPHLLAEQNAQSALNVKLTRASLAPFRQPLIRAALVKAGAIKSIYRFLQSVSDDQQYWFHWLNDTDVVRGFVEADTLERTFFTEAGQPPQVTDASIATGGPDYPTASWQLGVPRPLSAVTLSVTGAATGEPEYVVVSYAFVNSRGEEGALAPTSNQIAVYPGQTLNIANMEGNPGGTWSVITKRIYVAQTDAQNYTAYRFWADVAVGTSTYGAQVNFAALGEEAASPSPLPPPTSLTSLDKHPNGFLVGLADNKFCRSEIFKGYAWPREYQDPIAGDPVACCVIGQSTVIGTKQGCYIAYGSDPLGQSIDSLKEGHACVSKRSMRLTMAGVVYAGPDGLVAVDAGGQSTVLSDGLFDRDQWQALKPESIHAVVHDGKYFFWYDTGTVKGGYILDFKEGIGLIPISVYATAAYSDPRTDALYLVQENQPSVYKWDAATAYLTMTWRSKDWTGVVPTWVGACKLVGDFTAGPATFNLYVDGQLHRSRTISSRRPFKIKPKRGERVSFEISGLATITEVHLAGTVHDLANQ